MNQYHQHFNSVGESLEPIPLRFVDLIVIAICLGVFIAFISGAIK